MRRLIEDYREKSALLCNLHQPGNSDSLPKKKTPDIETLNIYLFYLIKSGFIVIDVNDLGK